MAKTKIKLDTLTTRFLILFILVMSIPLVSMSLFSDDKLKTYILNSFQQQVLIEHESFRSFLSNEEKKLKALARNEAQKPDRARCKKMASNLCRIINTTKKNSHSPYSLEFVAHQLLNNSKSSHDNPTVVYEFINPSNNTSIAPTLHMVYMQHLDDKSSLLLVRPLENSLINEYYSKIPTANSAILISKKMDQSGQKRLVSQNLPNNSAYFPPGDISAIAENVTQARNLQLYPGQYQQYYILTFPLYGSKSQLDAYVSTVMPLKDFDDSLKSFQLEKYIIFVLGLLIAITVAIFATRTITRPVFRLIDAIETIHRKGFQREKVQVEGVEEINQLTISFNSMLEKLEDEYQIKDEFVATLTHDLKVPLLAEKQTLHYLGTQNYGPLNNNQKEVIETLQATNEDTLGLVNGILEVYRYDYGQVQLMCGNSNLANILNDIITEMTAMATEKEISINYNSEHDVETLTAYVDERELRRVLQNLLNNAIINTPRYGSITCALTDMDQTSKAWIHRVTSLNNTTLKQPLQVKDRLLVTIEDTGTGFSVEDLDIAFKQFATNRSRNPMSMGLGLYNAHQVIEAHGAELWIETTEGIGSAINFLLPKSANTMGERRIHHDRRSLRKRN